MYYLDYEHSPFAKLLSLAEAAEIWKVDQSAIRHAISSGRLIDGLDCRKFGKQWVITVGGMKKAFSRCGQTVFDDYLYWHGTHMDMREYKEEAQG